MISEASVIVMCDLCREEVELHLVASADGESYSLRCLRPELRRMRWIVEDGSDEALCPDCAHLETERAAARRTPKRTS
ncbi:hypothetical protein [Chelatococcus reniformis]|uniref:Uncharacterized protein n=1 Tax=Chelatococcus reniformis TaxID=1494448 RepID=A0A916XH93_9HYPH|nr:hypothetical protein [Chelatococcus reniformis]GGC70323.1 hypothetical protein GCM10010994_31090 [Chelatococcus reniformis]